MRSSEFEYLRPTSLDEAVEALAAPGARVVAGGQSLVPALALRELHARTLVDVAHLPELRGLVVHDDGVVIGAAEPLRTLERSAELAGTSPLLTRAIATVAAMAIRSRCSLGGSVAWRDRTSQLPAALVALDAAAQTNLRHVPVLEVLSRGLEPGEIITQIHLPRLAAHGVGFAQVRRTHITWPVAGAAAICLAGRVRLALYGAGPSCVLIERASADRALAEVETVIDPFDDERASASYRRQVLPVLAQRAVTEAEEGSHAGG